jgi:hypothetical protein
MVMGQKYRRRIEKQKHLREGHIKSEDGERTA